MNRYKIGYCVGCGIQMAFIVFCIFALILITQGAAWHFNDEFVSQVADAWWAFPLICICFGAFGAFAYGPIEYERMKKKDGIAE